MEEQMPDLMNIIYTIIGFYLFWLLINWLDRNVFNKNRYHRKDENK